MVRNGRNAAGFTLVELLVVLSLITLAMWWIWPAGGPLGGNALTVEAERLVTVLKGGKSVAARRNRAAVFELNLETGAYAIRGTSRAGAIADDIDIDMVAAEQESPGPNIAGIRFYPDGSNTGGLIKLQKAPRTVTVTVDWLTGRITSGEK